MKHLIGLLLGLSLFASVSAFAADTPECQYWKGRLADVQQRITDAQAKLNTCTANCDDLENYIDSLKSEKDSDESFIADFCQP